MRINGFHQITAFYSLVFSQKHDFKPQHVSLYVFLLNQNNRNNWVEWFKCPIDLGMAGSCIGSKKTYYACLDDLQAWGLLKYEKGENMWKAPKIKLEVLKQTATYTSTVPQSEPLPTPQPIPLPDLNLPTYINLQPTTGNLQQETNTRPPEVAGLDFMGLQAQVEEWLEYKKAKGKKYKSQVSIQVMIKKLHRYSGGNPQKAQEIIEDAMASNYDGFYEPKQPTHSQSPRSTTEQARNERPHPYANAKPEHIQLQFDDYDQYVEYCKKYNLEVLPKSY